MLVAARLLVGLAIGVASYAVPLYISELAPPQARGWLVSLNQLAITLGILLSYAVDYAFSTSQSWRWMLGLAVIPAVLLFIGVAVLPETPRWLVRNGQILAARRVLLQLRGRDEVEHELTEIEGSARASAGGWSDLFAPSMRIAVVVGIGLVNVLMTIVAMLLVDRVGRRPLLIGGMAIMAVSLAALGLAFRLTGLIDNLGVVSVICLMIYVGAFAISLGPIFWLLIAEIYPLRVRGLAAGVATTANWASNLLVSLTFLTLTEVFGPSTTFWLYGLLTVAAIVFAFKLVPETKGRSLEEIEAIEASSRRPEGMRSDAALAADTSLRRVA